MNRRIRTAGAIVLTSLLAAALPARAAEPAAAQAPVVSPAPADATAAAIIAKLKSARPDLRYEAPRPSRIAGLWSVRIVDGPTIYIDADGSHFVAGEFYEVRPGQFVNLDEMERQRERREAIALIRPEDMIVFPAAQPRAMITVFTDVDCGYCRKLHSEIKSYNDLGISVRYLAFPRAGIGSPSYRKIATAWCSKDRQGTLTRMKNGEAFKDDVCKDNPVAQQYELGERLGVTGTPAIVLADGTMVPGYRPAPDLAAMLHLK